MVAACLLVLGVYVALSFVNDPRGFLGTDTGAKVATLRAMDRGHHGLDPDVGYWAARWDPTGRLHPLYDTARVGHRWVDVTTVPMLYLGYPLYRLGGYRLALLLPMLGAVAAALAARALARRLGADERVGWAAFYLVAVASPLAIYALDFWEHSIGVALMGWGVVLLLDVARGRAGWKGALGAGALFGAAATMRQEGYVYGAVAAAVACLWLLSRHRRLLPAAAVGVAVVAGLAVPLVGNQALERATVGASLRSRRATYSASGQAVSANTRLQEAALTGLGLQPDLDRRSYAIGAAVLVLLLLVARGSGRPDRAGLAVVAAAGVIALYALRFADGLGFVPGLIAATPLAAVGLAFAARGVDARLVAAVALIALPLVWAFQFPGGASPQWAGRYILSSGFLFGVVGVASLGLLAGWARVGVVGLAVAVTGFGLGWLDVRSHDVGRAAAALDRRPEPVLVSRVAHLAREGGAFYGDKRWLTAVTDADQDRAAAVLQQAGVAEFGLVTLPPSRPAPQLGPYGRGATTKVRLFAGVPVDVTTYRRGSS